MNKKLYKLMNWPGIEAIVYADEPDPYKVLGARQSGANVLVQTFWPGAEKADLIIKQGKEEKRISMELADEAGFFATLVPGKASSLSYEFELTKDGKTVRRRDAYAYSGYEIKGADAKKLIAGEHHGLASVLGAQITKCNGTGGVRFALWAPNAVSVGISGSFNDFTARAYQMKKDEETGLFTLFVPEAKAGDRYVYVVKAGGGQECTKLDPFARQSDLEGNLSVVAEDTSNIFNDEAWMKKRGDFKRAGAPLSVYEVFPGSFQRKKDAEESEVYRRLSESLPKYASETGFTHVDLMPLTEYLSDESLGYKTTLFYAPTARYGSPAELKKLINECHKNDIGVILDFRISDFDKDEMGLADFDQSALYEYADPGLAAHPEGDRLNFDLGKARVRDFLISAILYWIREYHIDGIKLENLSSMLYLNFGKEGWIPRYNIYGGGENLEAIGFLKELTSAVKKAHKDVLLLADEVTGFPYVTGEHEDGLGFDLKLNNGFITDYLHYICDDPHFRASGFNRLSESMAYQYTEHFVNALSQHEFLNGYPSMLSRMVGSEEEKFANLRLTYAYLFTHPGRKLIFEGQEFGVSESFSPGRPTDFSLTRFASHKGVRALYRELNKLYKGKCALSELDDRPEGFEWINALPDERCILSFLRKGKADDEVLLIALNFSGEERTVRVGTPYAGKFKELINTDAKEFGGKNRVNARNKAVTELEADGRPYSVELRLAPYSGSILKYLPFTELEKFRIAKKKEAAEAKTKAAEYAEEARIAEEEAAQAKEAMEEAKKRMKDALARAKEAHEKEENELERAKRSLAEASE